MSDYYAVLGVAPDASAEEIEGAHRRLARAFHPDVAGPAGAPRFAEAARAYEVLSDPEERARYDAWLALSALPVPTAPTHPRRVHPAWLAPVVLFGLIVVAGNVDGAIADALGRVAFWVGLVICAITALLVFTPFGWMLMSALTRRAQERR